MHIDIELLGIFWAFLIAPLLFWCVLFYNWLEAHRAKRRAVSQVMKEEG